MHKLLTSQQQTSELMYGFEESENPRRQELTNSKSEKRTFFEKIRLIDLFGFADMAKFADMGMPRKGKIWFGLYSYFKT